MVRGIYWDHDTYRILVICNKTGTGGTIDFKRRYKWYKWFQRVRIEILKRFKKLIKNGSLYKKLGQKENR